MLFGVAKMSGRASHCVWSCEDAPSSGSACQTFAAPSFDDKILEVVAVFGSMQMAVSRVIRLQHHRIAQVKPWLTAQLDPICPFTG